MDRQAIIFELLKEISGDSKFTYKDFNLEIQGFGDIVEMVQNEGLIIGANIIKGGQGNSVISIILDNAKITMKGMEYLQSLYDKENEKKDAKLNNENSLVEEVVSKSDLSASVIAKSNGKPIRESFSKWSFGILPLLTDSSREVMRLIGTKLQDKFDAQGGFAKTSVHLYQVNKKDVVFAHLKIEDGTIWCVAPTGLRVSGNVKAHKCVAKLKKLGGINLSNVQEFVDILKKALNNPDDIENKNVNTNEDDLQITSIHSDSVSGDDLLNISKDVKAIANLIALKDLDTPLSIGLFGNWGSGKSFFMNKVKKEVELIEKLSKSKEQYKDVFCDNIIQIDFNAWHFSDSNLWASLVEHIFETISIKLNNNAEKSGIKGEYMSSVLEKLESFQEQKERLKLEQDKLDKKIKELEDASSKYDKMQEKSIDIIDIVRKIFEDEMVKEEIKKYSNVEFQDAMARIQDTQNGIEETIYEVKGTLKEISLVWKIMDKGSLKVIGLVFLFIFLLLYGLPIIMPVINSVINSMMKTIISLISALTYITLIVKNESFLSARHKVRDWCKFLMKLKSKQKQGIEIKQREIALELNDLKRNIERLEKESKVLDESIEDIQVEITDISRGKYIKYFIEKRLNSNDYKKHLGIINLIRKDFENLSSYLQNPKTEEIGEYTIDRIILYIDDLDRCPPAKVVQILEAIHLLLSFKLFVVIVAVDVRWVSSCLCQIYKDMFRENNINVSASSYDYLEKIFQLPIKIEAIEDCENLINSLTRYNHKERTKNSNHDIKESNHLDPVNMINADANEAEELLSSIKIMQISDGNIKEIHEFKGILGNTPRTIKRFINIFKLIKASNFGIKDNREMLFLLSIVTGLPNISNEFFKTIKLADDDMDISTNFVSEFARLYKGNANDIEVIEVEKNRLIDFTNALEQPLLISKLKPLILLVNKYSFHLDY